MSERRPPGVLGSLPNTRPHRRSEKRASAAAPTEVETADSRTPVTDAPVAKRRAPATHARAKAPATQARAKAKVLATQPKARAAKPKATPKPKATAVPPQTKRPQPAQPERPTPAGTAVQAAAELAEIGLMAGARALRRALSRLPRR